MPYNVEHLRHFVQDEIAPVVSEIESSRVYPRALMKKLAGHGYLTPSLPAEYGGLHLNPLEYGRFTETVGKVCHATCSLLTVHNSLIGETILRWGSREQKSGYLHSMAAGETIGAFALTEPKIGSDAKNISTAYEKDTDAFVLTGKKKWISFGGIADFFLVVASKNGLVTAFLVDRRTEGVRVDEMQGLLAGNGVHIAEIEFSHAVVPAAAVLGGEGNGMNYIVSTALDHGRYSIAWSGIAIAQAALEAMVTYARQREQFGEKLYHHGVVQQMIGESTAKLHAARALCEKTAAMRMENHPDAVMETNMAKYISSKAAVDISNAALQVHGGNGCSDQFPVEKLFREARVLEIIEGTSQIQEKLISSYALRNYFVKDLYAGKDI